MRSVRRGAETRRRLSRNRETRNWLEQRDDEEEGKDHMKRSVLDFALRAAGSAGVAFKELAGWLSPFGWSRQNLSPILREMREEGLTELAEDLGGEILEVRLTDQGERELTATGADR